MKFAAVMDRDLLSSLASHFNHSYLSRAMVWDVGSGELRQIADLEPSVDYYTRSTVGLSVWEVVQIALGAMVFSCFILGTLFGCCLSKLFGNNGTQRATAQASIPQVTDASTQTEPEL